LPFEADVTDAVVPGRPNLLAIRITNPGGRLDWIDVGTLRWGDYDLPLSHGFGGLDAGIAMLVRPSVCVSDFYVLNKPDRGKARLVADLRSYGPVFDGDVNFAVRRGSRTVWTGRAGVKLAAGGSAHVEAEVSVPDAEVWDLRTPVLYRASAALEGLPGSGAERDFGFRWFTVEGLGSNARLVLNGKRIVLRSAISWQYWGRNGLWPDAEMGGREVSAAKALGLNCLQAHRNVARPLVLDLQDNLGLLRYEEPGDGQMALGGRYSLYTTVGKGPADTSGSAGDAQTFTERFEEEKLLQMVRRDRSHPCLIIYSIQNEIDPDLQNPRIYRLLRRVHAEDPSRIVVLKSGISHANMAWMMPWDDTVRTDDGTGKSGWADDHTVGTVGNYTDSMYLGPGSWSHRSDNRGEIVVWGEMLALGVSDDHEQIVRWYREQDRPGQPALGYDRADHERVLAAYDHFLDRWGFRGSFPTASSLFKAVGEKSYFLWQKSFENCRISDPVDYMVVNGWESNFLDQNSGLVDAYRFFKADPAIVRAACAPEVLVVRPRKMIVARGDTAVIDVHLVNETGRCGPHNLTLVARADGGRVLFRGTARVNVTGGDTFGQLLHAGFTFRVTAPGMIALEAVLAPVDGRREPLKRTDNLLCVDLPGPPLPKRIIVREIGDHVAHCLAADFGVTALSKADRAEPVDAIVVAEGAETPGARFSTHDPIAGTDDQPLYQEQAYGPAADMAYTITGLKPGRCKVDLHFAETYFTEPGSRVFDVAINGKTVLDRLDIFREAGGKNRALVRSFEVDAPDGVVAITVPKVEVNFALFMAIKVTDAAGKVVAVRCAGDPYTDHTGLTWGPPPVADLLTPDLLDRVARDGTRLVLWPEGWRGAEKFARTLADRGLVSFGGMVGERRVCWTGSWYFVRSHWLFDGLPTACAMDWRYQVWADGSNGLLAEAPGMQVAAGYGRDHDANVGIAACVFPHGAGKIVLFCLPGLVTGLDRADGPIHPVIARRLLANALR
jgi:hypothetical protein